MGGKGRVIPHQKWPLNGLDCWRTSLSLSHTLSSVREDERAWDQERVRENSRISVRVSRTVAASGELAVFCEPVLLSFHSLCFTCSSASKSRLKSIRNG